MAEYSLFWGGTATGDAAQGAGLGAPYTDQAFADFIAALFNYNRDEQGVVLTRRTPYNTLLWAEWDGLTTVTVHPGMAIVDGTLYLSTESETYNTPTEGWYQVVLRKDFAAQTVRQVFRSGTSLTQTDGVVWEIELWRAYYLSAGFDSELRKYDKRRFIQGSNNGIFKLDEVIIGYDRGSEGAAGCSFSVSGLVSGYPFKALEIHYEAVSVDTSAGTESITPLRIYFNGDTVGTAYSYAYNQTIFGAAEAASYNIAGTSFGIAGLIGANAVSRVGSGKIYIPAYAHGSSHGRMWLADGVAVCPDADDSALFHGGGRWGNTSAITSVSLVPQATAAGLFQYGRFYLYGWI